MTDECRDCRDGLDHCHGTAVHHLRFGLECTDDCAAPDAPHAFRIDCDAIGCSCVVTINAIAM
jgi:hypothetical protein